MREFFINSFEKLVAVIIVVMCIAVVVAAIAAASEGGILAFLGILVVGAIYVVLMGGFMYLGIGIYHNTKRMADAMDKSGRPT